MTFGPVPVSLHRNTASLTLLEILEREVIPCLRSQFQGVSAIPHLIAFCSDWEPDVTKRSRRSISFLSKILKLSSYLYLQNAISLKDEIVHVWRHHDTLNIQEYLILLSSRCIPLLLYPFHFLGKPLAKHSLPKNPSSFPYWYSLMDTSSWE